MTKIVIYDAMSSIRERMEARREPAHMMVRGVINDALIPGRTPIFVWDGAGGNDKRRAIFPGYKQRPPTERSTYLALQFIRELLAFTPAWQARLDGYEGDDVIAALVGIYAKTNIPIQIHTRDGDLTALCTAPHITCTAKPPVEPHLVRLYKLCVGDKSDTIRGLPGFGQKSWDAADKEGLRQILSNLPLREEDEKRALAVGLPKSCFRWLCDQRNADELNAMRRVIEPLPIPVDELSKAIVAGKDDPIAREAMLKRFLL